MRDKVAAEPSRARRNRRVLGIVVGSVLAISGVVGVILLTRSNLPGGSIATRLVVVTRVAVDARNKFTPDNVELDPRPVDQLPADALTRLDAVVGKFATVTVSPNAVLLPSLMVAAVPALGTVPVAAPLDIAKGDVAMAIPVDDQKGVGGYVQPEDRIDMLVDTNGNGNVRYALQDIRVIRVGPPAQQGVAGASSLLVVEVTRAQAEELGFLVNGRGTLAGVVRYVLRPQAQAGKGYLDSGDLVPNSPPYQDRAVNPTVWSGLFP